jgi:hypothetical protein
VVLSFSRATFACLLPFWSRLLLLFVVAFSDRTWRMCFGVKLSLRSLRYPLAVGGAGCKKNRRLGRERNVRPPNGSSEARVSASRHSAASGILHRVLIVAAEIPLDVCCVVLPVSSP